MLDDDLRVAKGTTYGYDGGMKHFMILFVVLIGLGIFAVPTPLVQEKPNQTKIYSDIGKKLLVGKHYFLSTMLHHYDQKDHSLTVTERDGTLYVNGLYQSGNGFMKMDGIITEVHKDHFIFDGKIHLFYNHRSLRSSWGNPYLPGENDCVGYGPQKFYMIRDANYPDDNGFEVIRYTGRRKNPNGITEYWEVESSSPCVSNRPLEDNPTYENFSIMIFVDDKPE